MHHNPKGNTLFLARNPLSPEQSSYDCDLAIHVVTMHNTRRVQYPPLVSPLCHAQIIARRAKMRELTTLVRELNDTLEDAGPSDGINWEKATISIIISLSQM